MQDFRVVRQLCGDGPALLATLLLWKVDKRKTSHEKRKAHVGDGSGMAERRPINAEHVT